VSKWRVRVREDNYGRRGVVFITRQRFPVGYMGGIRVAVIDLTDEDADYQIAEARAKARSLAQSVTELEAA
jgi:hypothetical protein